MKSPEPSLNPMVTLFLDCHGKIRFFLNGFRKVVENHTDPRVPAAAAQIARYLREGLPLHAKDEDQSLGPRLLVLHPELAGLMRDLAADHQRMDEGMPLVLALLDRLASQDLPPKADLAQANDWLHQTMLPHLLREETELFPRCASFSADQQQQVIQELRARRA